MNNRIKEQRIKNGYSYETFAHLMGVNVNTIKKYEDGNLKVPENKLEKLAKILRCSTSYLEGWITDVQDHHSFYTTDNITKDEDALLTFYRKLNDKGKVKAIDYIYDLNDINRYRSKKNIK